MADVLDLDAIKARAAAYAEPLGEPDTSRVTTVWPCGCANDYDGDEPCDGHDPAKLAAEVPRLIAEIERLRRRHESGAGQIHVNYVTPEPEVRFIPYPVEGPLRYG